MIDPKPSENAPQAASWRSLLTTIESCDGPKLRSAILALIADTKNRKRILAELLRIIRTSSEIAYRPIPDGLEPGQEEKYREMVRAATVQHAASEAVLGLAGPDLLLDRGDFLDAVDRSGMLRRLAHWTEHLTTMRDAAARAVEEFKSKYRAWLPRRIQVFGVGGSGAPHDIAAQVISSFRKSRVQIEVFHADQPNPDYTDPDTLAILSSFSGNTEETLHCYEEVRGRAGALLALGQGGKLRDVARRDGLPFIQLPDDSTHPAYVLQPRESACLQMTSVLTFLAGLGLPSGSKGSLALADLDLDKAARCLQSWHERFRPAVPYPENPAKRLAMFLLYGLEAGERSRGVLPHPRNKRKVFVLADRNIAALAHEVRTQLHERSKLNCACYEAPECLHNLLESIRAAAESSRAGLDRDDWVYYFIRSSDEEERVALRLDKTIELVMRGRATFATLRAEGDNPFHRALFVTYFNAYVTTYLAILNGFDPLPVATMSWMKKVMDGFPRGPRTVQEPPQAGGVEFFTPSSFPGEP